MILDKLQSATTVTYQQVVLNWRGEPTLNTSFPQLLAAVLQRKPPCSVEFHTNGTLINDRSAESLVIPDPNLSINVSVDGGSPSSHDRNRGAGTFRKAMRGLHALLRARGDSRYPRINIHQLDLREDPLAYDGEFLAVTKLVDEWQLKKPIVPTGDRTLFKAEDITVGGSAYIQEWPTAPSPIVPSGACFFAGNSLCISPSGAVSVCLLSGHNDGVVGNLQVDPVDTIISRAIDFRNALELGRERVPHCKQCQMENGNALDRFSEGSRELLRTEQFRNEEEEPHHAST